MRAAPFICMHDIIITICMGNHHPIQAPPPGEGVASSFSNITLVSFYWLWDPRHFHCYTYPGPTPIPTPFPYSHPHPQPQSLFYSYFPTLFPISPYCKTFAHPSPHFTLHHGTFAIFYDTTFDCDIVFTTCPTILPALRPPLRPPPTPMRPPLPRPPRARRHSTRGMLNSPRPISRASRKSPPPMPKLWPRAISCRPSTPTSCPTPATSPSPRRGTGTLPPSCPTRGRSRLQSPPLGWATTRRSRASGWACTSRWRWVSPSPSTPTTRPW